MQIRESDLRELYRYLIRPKCVNVLNCTHAFGDILLGNSLGQFLRYDSRLDLIAGRPSNILLQVVGIIGRRWPFGRPFILGGTSHQSTLRSRMTGAADLYPPKCLVLGLELL